jgi:hypothetical protein
MKCFAARRLVDVLNAAHGTMGSVWGWVHDIVEAASASVFVPDAVVAAHGSIHSRRGVGSQGAVN